ncbi:hypothetical protein AN477_16080 [Alicyclobacillus ferrooxydans]|uniref:Uncharacterized protein n=2 Tax=Alicyclobacillus ferrooxydans TaxID=471514 RepID=A0A0P9CI43_9BACL|nr:hypothetical protein AN477_16080 [Alicyclobacillus ferrooxydans]
MIGFANQSAAMEFLLSVKSGVKDMAFALTEASTPEVREWLKKQLFAGLNMHEKVYQLMVDRAWLHPYDPIEQSRVDLTAAEMTGNIARMPLFKDRTKVLETFDTPN